METINIQVTESMRQFIHEQVSAGKSSSPSAFVEDLLKEAKNQQTRPKLIQDLDSMYKTMSEDESRETEAKEWADGTYGDVADETR